MLRLAAFPMDPTKPSPTLRCGPHTYLTFHHFRHHYDTLTPGSTHSLCVAFPSSSLINNSSFSHYAPLIHNKKNINAEDVNPESVQ
ncbi:unnamed protein product [Sphenostylis stenocarpa]|uniref:Uncharacterized protein n=1 Tax=Sphenostylis stenocarpa TaxID=92480 RepID=A0AA86SGI3_9FABA|nr:unnamed protein product [Sphenostylis stenocarpa]